MVTEKHQNSLHTLNLLISWIKGDLKSLEIQPEQNVYMVSGKTKNDEDYSSTILYNNEKDLQKITDTAKKQDGLKFKVKEEENKVSLLVFYQH